MSCVSTRPAPREFTWVEGLALALSMIGVQLSSEVMNQWGFYFYSPSEGVGRTIYVAVGMAGMIFIIGTIWDAVTDPLVGIWSDKTNTRPGLLRLLPIRGRRRPFIFWGSLFMIFSAIAFWFPPINGTSLGNFAYGTLILCLHWTMFTITVVPLNALGPEIARSEQARVRLGTWIAVGMVVGLAMAAVLPGVLVVLLDPSRNEGEITATGYRRVAALFAMLSFLLFQLPVWLVKERYDSEAATAPHTQLLADLLDAFRNRAFVVYCAAFFLFTSGFLAAQRALPYWAELGLKGDESTVTLLMIPFILVALLSYVFIPFAARRVHMKWIMSAAFLIISTGLPCMYIIGVAPISTGAKIALGAVLFGYCGIGQGIIYVMMTPMLGEIIDYDEQYSGHRREALYNGLSGFAWKASMGISVFTASQSMHRWGHSAEQPAGVLLVGPIAGLFGFLGLIAILFYPILHVTKKTEA